MRELQNAEDVDPVVGEYYLVNVVETDLSTRPWNGETLPILGTLHEDREIIRFPYDHYHVDWRFVEDGVFRYVQHTIRNEFTEGLYDNAFLGLPISRTLARTKPRRKPLKCIRRPFVWACDNVPWMARLERAYLGKRAEMTDGSPYNPFVPVDFEQVPLPREKEPAVRVCKTCPHRGISLIGAPEDEHGAVVCPGHGLAWEKHSGILAPRAMVLEDFKKCLANRITAER